MDTKRTSKKTGAVREWLISIRKSQDKTQGQVAAAAGITQPSYSQIEKGQISPAIQTAKLIGAELGFPWTKFYEDKEEEDDICLP